MNSLIRKLTLGIAVALASGVRAQTAPPPLLPLSTLLQHIQAKAAAGERRAADFQPELDGLDQLLAAGTNASPGDKAMILYTKAMVEAQLLKQFDDAARLIRQIQRDEPKTEIGLQADDILAGLARAQVEDQVWRRLQPGLPFPDFAAQDLNGRPLSVGALKGKVVLVDFWATWCPLCVEALPGLQQLYQAHHKDGLEIIGISLDADRTQLENFLQTHPGMSWPQYDDGRKWDNLLAVKYAINALPCSLLIGRDGRIIGSRLTGAELDQAVTTALSAP